MDLRNQRPGQTFQNLVNTDGNLLYDGSGSLISQLELTTSYAIYQVSYEISSSFASSSLSSSVLFGASSSIDINGNINFNGRAYIGNALTHSGLTFKNSSSATPYATNEVELTDTYLTFLPPIGAPSIGGTERRIYSDVAGNFTFDSLDNYSVTFINADSYSFDNTVIAPLFKGTASFALNAIGGTGTTGSTTTAYFGGYAFSGSYFNYYTSSYTLTNADNGKIVSEASASAISYIYLTASLDSAFSCMVYQSGSGTLIVTGSDSSTLIRNRAGSTTLAGQYAVASIFRAPNGDFVLSGDTLV